MGLKMGKKIPFGANFLPKNKQQIVQLVFLTKIAFFSQILVYCAFVVTDQKENN